MVIVKYLGIGHNVGGGCVVTGMNTFTNYNS